VENIVLGYGGGLLLWLLITTLIGGFLVPIGSGVKKNLMGHALGRRKGQWADEEIARLNPFWYGFYMKLVAVTGLVGMATGVGFLVCFFLWG
jgi:hypothetical protein